MAWNEPGNNSNNNDPWGGGGRKGPEQGPPDIDEVVRKLSKKLNGVFGGGGSGRSCASGSGGGFSGGLLAVLVVVAVGIWAFGGFYIVDQAERAIVLRFGKVLDTTVQPGLHWNPPLIDEVSLVNVSQLNAKTYDSNAMLTTDENIIDIEVTVQYRIDDPVKYVLAVQDPQRSLDNAAESAIRHVVGGNFMDQILTTGRDRVADDVQERLQDYMDNYDTGIVVSQVNVVDAQPPQAVRPAFDDVIRAREDEQRAQNQRSSIPIRSFPRPAVSPSAASNRLAPTAKKSSRRQQVMHHALISSSSSTTRRPKSRASDSISRLWKT
jgi:membrane protease subunit HflK